MRSTSAPSGAAPPLFFRTPDQRTALARERFFESGERPSGLVNEAIIQSWQRCLAARQSPQQAVAFDPVTRSRFHAARERSRALLVASGDDIGRLEAALLGTGASVLLTDAQGVIVHATAQDDRLHARVRHVAARVGVDLSEASIGTNAPAVVVKTCQAVSVHGAEHFFERVHSLHCAAAPIRDGQGRLAGVLDLTVESRPFAFDAAALVGVYATMIENRLLQATSEDCLVLQFQVCSSMIDSPLQALVGVDSRGRLAWHNGTAQKLLGLDAAALTGTAQDAETVFGVQLAQLLAQTRRATATAMRLPNGLTVWLRARDQAGPAATARTTAPMDVIQLDDPPPPEAETTPSAAVADPVASTLNQHTSEVIDRALAECDGNVSRAARRLGVSRGLVYRRLRMPR